MKISLRLNTRALPVISFLALVMQIIAPSRVWVILLVGIGGAWLVCWWWARRLAGSLKFERKIRFGWAQVGDRLEEQFTLTNTFWLPVTWVAVHDHSTLPDHYASVATGVDASSTSRWHILTQCTRRGVYTLGGTTLETGDPFGIYTVTLKDSASSTLAVMPPVVSLPKFEILSSSGVGEGKPRRYSLEETINVSQTREMLPNDPRRLIHWKTTARQGKFFVRQFEGAPAGDWWIVLDLEKTWQVGTGWDSTEEHAVILASSLAAQGLNADHPVGLSINGSQPDWLVPQRNEHQLRALLKALAVASPSEISLRDYLERAGRSLRSHSSLLIITANTDAAWIPSILPLMWRGIMPTVFLFDLTSFGGSANTNGVYEVCQSLNIPCHLIPKQMLDQPQARPGHEGEWEWRILPTGKAVAVREARADWQSLQ